MMWRAYLSLVSTVVIALLLSWLLAYLPTMAYVQKRIGDEVNSNAGGVFYMLEQALQQQSDQPEAALRHLQSLFPYGVELLDGSAAAELPLDKPARALLEGGRIGYFRETHTILVKRIVNGQILLLHWDPPPQLDAEQQAGGVLHLIEQQLQPLPQAQWPQRIAELATHFDFPVDTLALAELDLTEAEQQIFHQGRLLSRIEGDTETIYAQLLGSDLAVRAGPIRLNLRIQANWILLVPVLLTLLALALWFWLLWRDIQRLNAAALRLGQGELDSRLALRKSSPLAGTAHQFNQTAADLSQLIRGSRELTNAVSHDLKTPLARMRFALEMLQSRDTAQQGALLQGLQTDVDELAALVEELLDNARYERQLALKPARLDDFPQWLQQLTGRIAQLHDTIDCRLQLDDDLPQQLWLDRQAFARAYGNVLRNALDYAQQRVDIRVSRQGADCRLQIDDDGPGIAAEACERVFQPFVRLEADRGRKGHGLGLAIARKILRQHAGDIHIERASSGGARVVLQFPIEHNHSERSRV